MTTQPKTRTRYRVWIAVEAEEIGEDNDITDWPISDVELPFASTGPHFNTEAEAVAFAIRLHMIGENR